MKTTPVGYAAWAIGGGGRQFCLAAQDDNDSIAAIHRALELGVNWIETAAVYGLGHSEQVVAGDVGSWPGDGRVCLRNAEREGLLQTFATRVWEKQQAPNAT